MSLGTHHGSPEVQSAEHDHLRKVWLLMLILGVALIAVGLVVIMYTYATLVATVAAVLMLGFLFVMGGVVAIVNAFWARRWRGFVVNLVAGILYLVVGFLLVQHPEKAAAFFTLMIAVVLFLGGLIRIAMAVTERYHGWVWGFLNGLISVALGVMIWQEWPESAFWVIGLFVGIDMLFAGWAWVMTALAIRNATAKPA